MSSREFCHSSKLQSESKSKQKDKQILGPFQRTKKAIEHEADSNTNCSWCAWNGHQRLEKKDLKNLKLENQDHLEQSIVEVVQYAVKTCYHSDPVKDHHLMLVWFGLV